MRERNGYVYYDNSRKCWYARTTATDENGKRRNVKRKAKTKTEANKLLKTIIRQIDDEGVKVIDFASLTFNDLADFYLKNYAKPAEYGDGKKIAGLRDYKIAQSFVKLFRQYFGAKKLREIKYSNIANYRSYRLKTDTQHKRKRTIGAWNREASVLRRMFNIAIQQGWIHSNPFNGGDGLIQTSFERRRETILTIEEEKRLLAVCSGEREIKYTRKGKEITVKVEGGRETLKALIIALLDSGARKGEMLKLTWQFVDFENRIITFQASTTKTLKTRRVAITLRLYNELQTLWKNSDKKPNSLVFSIANNVRRSFASACKDAGIKHGGIDGLTLHCLRHTAATRLVQGQLPIQLVGRILGHTQPQTTYRYISANEAALSSAKSIFEAVQVG